MLTLRGADRASAQPVAAFAGAVVRMGYVPPPGDEFGTARVLVVGDVLRRVLEDVHGAQVLAALVTGEPDVRVDDGLMIRPVSGPFGSLDSAAIGLGHRLSLVVTATSPVPAQRFPVPRPIRVGVVRRTRGPEPRDRSTLRFVLATTPYADELTLTATLLEHAQSTLDRWRTRLAEWSRHPSRPIPPAWLSAVIAALDDDLDLAAVRSVLEELEDSAGIEPGAKFETFAYLDRVLAVDLVRDLGRR
ncbi:hypothetical protein KO481_23280 [Nocardia sp. NEAU-G5]|uniref:Uncharacterized protein n=1 Tax=Nocardia albiluteola TaxID=2842303 RepID=A0ABS6B2B7_9NOCA|nr:hypothetical protein [Nocardia albiluteola]MBU3064444.1 hypothetical protein [Nocardia albiluteola]